MEICQKVLTPHDLPFKVTQGHWNRNGSIGYLWLPISVPYGPISYRSWDMAIFAKFSNPIHLSPPL